MVRLERAFRAIQEYQELPHGPNNSKALYWCKMVLYLCSLLASFLLAKLTGASFPSWSCSNTASIPTSDASVLSVNDYIPHHCSIQQKMSVLSELTLFYRNNWPSPLDNSFVSTSRTQLQVLCSTCGHKGVIKKTKETPRFMCLCQEGFYRDRCQHEGKFTYLFNIILLILLLLLPTFKLTYTQTIPSLCLQLILMP